MLRTEEVSMGYATSNVIAFSFEEGPVSEATLYANATSAVNQGSRRAGVEA